MSGRVSRAAILDIDGTLVDSNYQHAIAWARAFREHGRSPELWRIHRHIGMGGDQLVGALTDPEFEAEHGDRVRDSEAERYAELIGEVRPFDGALELIEQLAARDWLVVLASSAKAEEAERYVDMLEAREVVCGWTTSADVDRTKPEPDLVAAAMRKAGALTAVMVGDTVWDIEAARRADIKSIGMLTGGFGEAELWDAGAATVAESPRDLLARLDSTPLGE